MKTNTIPDSFFVERAQQGDPNAVETLIRRHKTKAYQFAYRLTKNGEEAADAVGTAFCRVYRSIGSFKGQCAFTTWLYRIITNCYLDLKKKEADHPTSRMDWFMETDEGEFFDLQVVDLSPSAFEEVLRKDKNSAVASALGDLPDYQRAILEMFHLELLTYEEISDALDLPMGTVKSRLNRARCGLARAMVDHLSLFDENDVYPSRIALA